MLIKSMGIILFITYLMFIWLIEWEYRWIIQLIHGCVCGYSFNFFMNYDRCINIRVQQAVYEDRLRCFNKYGI